MANAVAEHNERITEELVQNPELIKDKRWRLDNLYFIITKGGKKEVFHMNRAQEHFYTNYLSKPGCIYHRHIILKARQLGFTTFIDIFILDEILFQTNKEGIIIAHKVQDATEIFDKKIDFAVRNMAPDVKGAFFKIQHNSARKIQAVVDYGPNQGSTSSIAVSVSGRSGTYHLVHISEFAKMCVMFPKRAEEVETGTFPAVPFDGFIFIESTAEGMAGRFYEMFNERWNNRDAITPQLSQVQFLPHFYNWQYDDSEMAKIREIIPVTQMDECEIDWAEYQKENHLTDLEITYYYMKWEQLGGKGGTDAVKKLKQEYPTTPEEAFLSTGQSYFPIAKVASLLLRSKPGIKGELVTNDKGEVEFVANSAGNFEMWNKPVLGTKYIIGGDTSEGLAHGDAQVLYVINHRTEECDGLYRSQVPPDELANEAYKLGKFYNWALLAIEVNKDGLWVNDALEKLGYINLYSRKVFDDITQKITKFFGWKTTSSTRPFSLAALKAVFLKKDGGFPPALLNEMFTFIRNVKGKPEAMDKKNDDVVMASSIGYAVLQEQGKYIADTSGTEGFSHMRAIFGEPML
jgi:nitrous oxide reductase accessory protein NosL